MRTTMLLAVLTLTAGCTCTPGMNDGGGGGTGTGGGSGGGTGGGTAAHWSYFDLDPSAQALDGHALTIDRSDQRIGVAYFANVDGGSDREVRFVDWRNGSVSAPESWRVVQKTFGISIAFQPTSEPVVAYLGGGSDTSLDWTQSDVEMAFRKNGSWSTAVPFTMSGQIATGACNNVVSTSGFVVGLWPALTIVPVTGRTYLAFRDVHNGASMMGDWGGSDLKLVEGVNPNFMGTCIAPSVTAKAGVGNHNSITLDADGQPIVAFDLDASGSAAGTVLVTHRQSSGVWGAPVQVLDPANAGSGPSIAFDADGGFGVAVGDLVANKVTYVHSKDGVLWDATDTVFGSGSGGWNASLAFDPQFGEPAVAFYVCSDAANVAEGNCPQAQLVVMQKRAGNWDTPVKIDDVGAAGAAAVTPRLGFIGNGKRVVLYPKPPANTLRLAVEN